MRDSVAMQAFSELKTAMGPFREGQRPELLAWTSVFLLAAGAAVGVVWVSGHLLRVSGLLSLIVLAAGCVLGIVAVAAAWTSMPEFPSRRTLAVQWRHPAILPLVLTMATLAATGSLFALGFLLASPIRALQIAQEWLLTATAAALFLSAGIAAGTLRKGSVRSVVTASVLLSMGILILWNPQSGTGPHPTWLIPPVLLLLLAGGLGVGSLLPASAFDFFRRNIGRRAGLALVAACVLLALPGTLGPVAQWWNISGYMDSQMYDIDAHKIALGEIPQGNGFVMPLYQYGMAALYALFGHFFFVQQVANVILQLGLVALLVIAAMRLFGDYRAAVLMGIMAALTFQFRQFVKLTQIENWYVPLVALIVFTWTRYRARATLGRAVPLAIAIGLAFNCRSQGAFFFAWMCLAPLTLTGISRRVRFVHTLAIIAIVGASLLPWSLRNYVYEGRFSPSSDQATIGLLFNDHRVGFYGLRYDLYSWQTVLAEYEAKYPDKNERFQAIQRDAIANTVGAPSWWARAFGWRSLSFYGLLPPGVFAPAGPAPTNWPLEWRGYLYYNITSLVLIGISLLGLVMRPGRDSLFLLGGIVANLAVMLFGSQIEARISFPVLPLHMMLALAAIFPFVPAGTELRQSIVRPSWRYLLTGATVLVLAGTLSRVLIGWPNRHAPLLEDAIVVSATALGVHQQQGNAYRDVDAAQIAAGQLPAPGQRIRIRVRVSNYMLPPKSAGAVDYLPLYASDPAREQYFYAPLEDGVHVLGITYFGAVAAEAIHEYDHVTVEGIVLEGKAVPLLHIPFWFHAEAIYK